LSRADAGLARLRAERFDLAEMAEEIAGNLQVLAEEKQQTITVRHAGPAPCQGDQLMVRQAAMNLIDNAIKYGPDGGDIRVELRTTPTHVTLDVVDSGPGIDPERGARIFDRFYRAADSDETRGDGRRSHGLGLSIAHAAIKANQGTLTWEPRAEGGTVFRITLPLDSTSHAPSVRPQDSTRPFEARSDRGRRADAHPRPLIAAKDLGANTVH